MVENSKKRVLNVLYICHEDGEMGGGAYSMFNMISSIRYDINPYILTRSKSGVYKYARKNGYHIIVQNFKLNLANKNRYKRLLFFIPRLLIDGYKNHCCIKKIRKDLNGIRIDIVHSNSTLIPIGGDLAKELGAKHVWHLREFMNLDFGLTPIKGFRRLKKEICKADAVIAITNAVYNHWGCEKIKNSFILYNAVRSINDICEISMKDKEKYVLFCAGTICDEKGADVAAEIYLTSKISDMGYKMVFVGDCSDSYKQKLLEISSRYNPNGDNYEFVGYQKNIQPFMLKSSAFLMCSPNEAMGRVTVEAMFFGCPILGNNTGGTKEIIKNGYNGLLYKTTSEACILLKEIVCSDDLSNTLIKNAFQEAKTKFSEESYRNKILQIYHSI